VIDTQVLSAGKGWLVCTSGLRPWSRSGHTIRYKLVTITSGFAGYKLFLFVVLSLISAARASLPKLFCSTATAARAREIIEARPLGRPSGGRRGDWLYPGRLGLLGLR
jgi:hypothetical protein